MESPKWPGRRLKGKSWRRFKLRQFTWVAGVAWLAAACGGSTPEFPSNPAMPAAPPAMSREEMSYFEDRPLMVPVDGVSPDRVPDSFNHARSGNRRHNATDILAPRGTPVLAATNGRVARLQQNALGGITLYLTDDSGRFVYYYAHLDGYADPVTPGLRVEQGDVVGFVGTSGNAPPNTPHLHFQVMRIEDGRGIWNGTPVDVRPYMKKRGRKR